MAKVIGDYDLDLNRINRILVVAPHPDDELFGCGGTILELKRVGKYVEVIFITKGEKELNPSIRVQEACQVRERLGYDKVEFWDFPDGNTATHKEEIKRLLKNYAIENTIDLMLIPAPYDFHPDHKVLGHLGVEFHVENYPKRVAFYTVYNFIIGNFNFDVTNSIETFKDCIYIYSESLKKLSFLKEISLCSRKWCAEILMQQGFFESFFLIKSDWNMDDMIKFIMGDIFAKEKSFYKFYEVKNIQHVIGYSRYLEELLEEKAEEIHKLKEEISHYSSLENQLQELQAYLNNIEKSKFYRAMQKYHKIRDRLLPPGSVFRRIYDIVMGNAR